MVSSTVQNHLFQQQRQYCSSCTGSRIYLVMQEQQHLITKSSPYNSFDDCCCDSIIPAKGAEIPTESVFSMPIIFKTMAKRLSKICNYVTRRLSENRLLLRSAVNSDGCVVKPKTPSTQATATSTAVLALSPCPQNFRSISLRSHSRTASQMYTDYNITSGFAFNCSREAYEHRAKYVKVIISGCKNARDRNRNCPRQIKYINIVPAVSNIHYLFE